MSSTGRPSKSVMLKVPLVTPDAELQNQEQERVGGAVVLADAMITKVVGVLISVEFGAQPITLLVMMLITKPVLVANPLHITDAAAVLGTPRCD